MKKKLTVIIIVIAALVAAYIFVPGFCRNTSVFVQDYSVSPDGKEMTICVGVASSTGYVRDVAVSQQSGGKLYLDCYSAFGGINGSIGAKDIFKLQLDDNTEMIAICRNDGCYEKVLCRDQAGLWHRSGS